jgi:hypothetical protein
MLQFLMIHISMSVTLSEHLHESGNMETECSGGSVYLYFIAVNIMRSEPSTARHHRPGCRAAAGLGSLQRGCKHVQ